MREAILVLVYYVARQLVTNSITQCCINSLDCKLISVLTLTSCFNRFIMSDLLDHNLITVLVLISHTNDCTSTGSTPFTPPAVFVWHKNTKYICVAGYLFVYDTTQQLDCFVLHYTQPLKDHTYIINISGVSANLGIHHNIIRQCLM